MDYTSDYYAFSGDKLLASGKLKEIVISLKEYEKQRDTRPFLLFNGNSGHQVDLDLTGSDTDVLQRYGSDLSSGQNEGVYPENPSVKRSRGRPKLGVEGREVTLLPRHWEWLETQRGGASATIRRLIDEERRGSLEQDRKKAAQDATNRFMYGIGGNLPGFEEAIRALYSGGKDRFIEETNAWPVDIRECARRFAAPAFE